MRQALFFISLALSCALAAQDESTMREVSVAAFRRIGDTGLQRTTLDTLVLHQNVALSMSDILTQHSSLFIKVRVSSDPGITIDLHKTPIIL